MLRKVIEYWENDAGRDLYSYADTGIECIALYFIFVCFIFWKCISFIFLFITCPLWIIPYCIYKSRRRKNSERIYRKAERKVDKE